jgi:hypothetical protein
MQKEMATIELVAQDNHERARRLMKELSQMQQEYLELKKQVCTPEPQLTSPGHCAGTGRVYCCQYLFNRNVGLVKADCKECSSS